MGKPRANWIVPSQTWGLVERLFIVLLLGQGLIFLWPERTFTGSGGWYIIENLATWGHIWRADRAEIWVGLIQIGWAVWQARAVAYDKHRRRMIGMLLMMLWFFLKGYSFLVGGLADGRLGIEWFTYWAFAVTALVCFFKMDAYWKQQGKAQ